MRLLIVDEAIIAGGIDTLRRQLVPALARLVEAITWVLPAHVAGDYRELASGCGNVVVETLNSTEGIARIKEAAARRMPGGPPASLLNERLRRLARLHRCDVCMTTCVFGQNVPEVDLPVAGYVADLNPDMPDRIRDNIGRWVERTAMTFAISDFTCSELMRLRPICSDKIYSIPLAAPDNFVVSDSVSPGNFYYPAAPNRHKGHLLLLEAARRLAERGLSYRLTLTGAGFDGFSKPAGGNQVIDGMRDFLAEHRGSMDGRVLVAGDARPSEIRRHFAEASCVVLPSSYEGFGFPLAEALARGKPVICSDIPPFREQIERYGLEALATVIPVGDPGALEEAMAAHLGDDARCPLSSGELTEHLHRWTWADAAGRCRDLLEKGVAHG